MSTSEAVSNIAAVKPAKPAAKEKKAPAKSKPIKNASHPPYFEMIKDALLALKEKGGSSPYAISKYIEEKQKAALPANFRKILGQQLKNSAAKGKLIKVKASYKLSESGKKEAKEKKAPKTKVEKAEKTKEKKAPKTKVEKAEKMKEKKALKTKVEKAEKTVAAAAAGKPVKKAEAGKKAKKAAATPVKKPAKAKAKQPKSIKSPMKKAKKIAA